MKIVQLSIKTLSHSLNLFFFCLVGMFCICDRSLFAVDVSGKIQMHMKCLEPQEMIEEVWNLSKDEQQFLPIKNVIEQVMKEAGVARFEEIDYKLFQKLLKELEPYPQNIRDLITCSWTDQKSVSRSQGDMSIADSEYALQLLKTLLKSPRLTPSQYIDVLNRYTSALAYSDVAISALKEAQKRQDLNRDQRFYVDARLAYYDALNNGLTHLQNLIKRYPDKRQCVGICGEQIALRYRHQDNVKAMECYSKVFELCPEMTSDAVSLLGYARASRDVGKPDHVLNLLVRYIDLYPNAMDTLDVLQHLAYIYHDNLEEYDKAAQTWDRIVEFAVPESLLTEEIKDMKQKAKTSYKIALSRLESGIKNNPQKFTLPPRVFWTPSRIVIMILNALFILSFVLFCIWRRRSNNK